MSQSESKAVNDCDGSYLMRRRAGHSSDSDRPSIGHAVHAPPHRCRGPSIVVHALQVYGRDRTSKDVRQRWLASGIDMLLGMYGRLQVGS